MGNTGRFPRRRWLLGMTAYFCKYRELYYGIFKCFRGLCPLPAAAAGMDRTTGYLLSGITAGLGAKVIGLRMDYHCPSQNVCHPESSGQHFHVRSASTGKQWRQISCMVWMFALLWVKMVAGFAECLAAAGIPLMDMKAIDAVPTGQSIQIRLNHYAAFGLIEFHHTRQTGDFLSSGNAGKGLQPFR